MDENRENNERPNEWLNVRSELHVWRQNPMSWHPIQGNAIVTAIEIQTRTRNFAPMNYYTANSSLTHVSIGTYVAYLCSGCFYHIFSEFTVGLLVTSFRTLTSSISYEWVYTAHGWPRRIVAHLAVTFIHSFIHSYSFTRQSWQTATNNMIKHGKQNGIEMLSKIQMWLS